MRGRYFCSIAAPLLFAFPGIDRAFAQAEDMMR